MSDGQTEKRKIFVGAHLVSVAIWALLTSVFVLDLLTPADNISVCFAYAIPIFLSLFEVRPRPLLYAGTATALSVVGSLFQPPSDLATAVLIANRLIAISTQWLTATLVRLQQRRIIDTQEKAEIQRRFVDILSHEIGTALTAVTGHAYRLTKLSDQLSPSDVRLRADKIGKAAERIEAIIDRVQFASSLGDGTIPIGYRPIDLHTMMRQVTDQLKEERGGGLIELDLGPESQMIRGDEMLLRQLFENVIVNSMKYSPPHGTISVSITKQLSTIRVAIADRGSGIAPEELDRVKQAYYRGESSKGTSGAGLGLYFVERILEAHKGLLSIESGSDKGTKVIIDLPQFAGPAT